MDRKPSTTVEGKAFAAKIVDAVWQKARSENGYSFFKKDGCGATIKLTDYGKQTQYGWEIDHIKPVCKGGTDDMMNLQALHWQNNRKKADEYPYWECVVLD